MKETCGLQRDSRRWYLPLNEWFSWRSIWGLLAWRYKALYKVQDRGRQVNLAQEGKLSLWNVSKSCTDAAITLKTYVQASRKDLNDAELEMVTVDLLYDVLIACLFLACILKDFFHISYCCFVAKSCSALCNSMDCSMPGFPVLHRLPGLAQTHVHQIGDAIQPSHPLSSPSPPAFNLSQDQGLFQSVGCLHQVVMVLELQLQHQSLQWICSPDFR